MARGNQSKRNNAEYMCTDLNNFVVQSNIMITSRQNLSINAMKLVRLAIMQVKPDEKELKLFKITIQELANLLQVDASNLYKSADDITTEIMSKPLFRKNADGGWKKYAWVSSCEYIVDDGLYIKLNDELKPYLIGLKKYYTQYTLDCIIGMKSEYSIRFFELIIEKIDQQVLPINGLGIYISIEDIKTVCGCDAPAYEKFGKIKQSVIDKAISEINEKTSYRISYDKSDYHKNGRSVVGITFNVNMSYHKQPEEK